MKCNHIWKFVSKFEDTRTDWCHNCGILRVVGKTHRDTINRVYHKPRNKEKDNGKA